MGISQTGIINAFAKHGQQTMINWCDDGYQALRKIDEKYSDWLCVPRSKKMSTVKPSGTISLLAGVNPGVHYPHSEYYIRRIRFDKDSEYLPLLEAAGYKLEQDVKVDTSICVEFPIKEKDFVLGKQEVTIWEQLENASLYQYHWSDNQVSITVTFNKNEKEDLKRALKYFDHRLKAVSFLPNKDHGYKQAPYEEITKEQYESMSKKIKPLNLKKIKTIGEGEKFCTNDVCEVKKK
jgi:hypothetical protein